MNPYSHDMFWIHMQNAVNNNFTPHECIGGPADGEIVQLSQYSNSTQQIRGHAYMAHNGVLIHTGRWS